MRTSKPKRSRACARRVFYSSVYVSTPFAGLVVFRAVVENALEYCIFFLLYRAQCDFSENAFLDSCLTAIAPPRIGVCLSRWKWRAGNSAAAAAPLFLARTDRTRPIGFVLVATDSRLLVFFDVRRTSSPLSTCSALALGFLLIASSFVGPRCSGSEMRIGNSTGVIFPRRRRELASSGACTTSSILQLISGSALADVTTALALQ